MRDGDCFEWCQADVGAHGALFSKFSTQLRVEVCILKLL